MDKHIDSRSVVLNGIKGIRNKLNVTCLIFIIYYNDNILLYSLYICDHLLHKMLHI